MARHRAHCRHAHTVPVAWPRQQRIGEQLGSRATYGEGTQNVLCAILAAAVLVGLAANTLFGL